MLAADNLNVMNPVVLEALKGLDPKPLQKIAGQCQAAGADAIDINPGYLSKRYEDRITFLVEVVQEVTTLPLILDNPDPDILARGLQVCRQAPILNAATLETSRLQEILSLAVQHKTALIILLLDEKSFAPPTVDEKLALALEIREQALSKGLQDKDLIFDPVLPNLLWPDALPQITEVIKTIRLLASGVFLGEPVKTMAGLSNLRSGMQNRYPPAFEETCANLLAGAGLEILLANALAPHVINTLRLYRQLGI